MNLWMPSPSFKHRVLTEIAHDRIASPLQPLEPTEQLHGLSIAPCRDQPRGVPAMGWRCPKFRCGVWMSSDLIIRLIQGSNHWTEWRMKCEQLPEKKQFVLSCFVHIDLYWRMAALSPGSFSWISSPPLPTMSCQSCWSSMPRTNLASVTKVLELCMAGGESSHPSGPALPASLPLNLGPTLAMPQTWVEPPRSRWFIAMFPHKDVAFWAVTPFWMCILVGQWYQWPIYDPYGHWGR